MGSGMAYDPDMSITATVENGVIKLPQDASLPDGTRVFIAPLHPPDGKSFMQRFDDLIGSVKSGIGDLAVNHDHHLHGLPKQK